MEEAWVTFRATIRKAKLMHLTAWHNQPTLSRADAGRVLTLYTSSLEVEDPPDGIKCKYDGHILEIPNEIPIQLEEDNLGIDREQGPGIILWEPNQFGINESMSMGARLSYERFSQILSCIHNEQGKLTIIITASLSSQEKYDPSDSRTWNLNKSNSISINSVKVMATIMGRENDKE